MEPLDERLAKVLPAHFKAEKALVVRKNIHMTSNVVTEVAAGAVVKLDRVRKLPGDPKKLRGRVVVAPAAGWVTVTSKNLTRVDASAAPADDREDWEYDPRDSYDHYLTRAERCAWPAAKQRAKVAKLLEKEFPTVKLPAAARTSWSVSRMRAFLESKGAKGRPHAVVGVAAGGDPWAAAQAEYRLAMEGVEREALRAVERDNREWCKAWDEDRFRGAFLRPELASRVDDCRRALRFASSPGLERWLREGGKPNWDGPRDWLPPNGGWGDPLPSKTENLLGRLKSGTRRVERLDELTGTWHGFRRSYLPGAKPVALRPYDFRTYRHLASEWRRDNLLRRSGALPVEHVKAPYDGLLPRLPGDKDAPEPWEKKLDERWTTLRDFADAHLPGPEAATPYPEVDDAAAEALAGRCRHRPCVCQCLSADVDVDDPVFSVFASLPAVPPHFEAPTQHLPYQPTNRMAAHLAKCKPPILLAAHLQSDDDKTEYESSTDDGEWQPEYDTRLETPDALYPGRFELHVLPALGGERLSQRGGAAWHVLVHGRVRWCLLPPNGGRYVKRRYHELQRAPPKPAASCRHQDFVSGLDWFRSEFETLADPAARVPLSEIVQEAGEALWVPEGWSAARLALKPSVGFALDVGSLNAPGPRGNPPGIMDDDRPARPSIFTKHTDPEYLESDYSWIPDDAFLKQLEGLNTNLKKAMDEAAEKAAAKWAEQKFESGEWIRPENIAAAAAEAVRQVDELLPPPPPDSIAAAEPSEMLKRWAASPFHPDQNPSYLRQPEEG